MQVKPYQQATLKAGSSSPRVMQAKPYQHPTLKAASSITIKSKLAPQRRRGQSESGSTTSEDELVEEEDDRGLFNFCVGLAPLANVPLAPLY